VGVGAVGDRLVCRELDTRHRQVGNPRARAHHFLVEQRLEPSLARPTGRPRRARAPPSRTASGDAVDRGGGAQVTWIRCVTSWAAGFRLAERPSLHRPQWRAALLTAERIVADRSRRARAPARDCRGRRARGRRWEPPSSRCRRSVRARRRLPPAPSLSRRRRVRDLCSAARCRTSTWRLPRGGWRGATARRRPGRRLVTSTRSAASAASSGSALRRLEVDMPYRRPTSRRPSRPRPHHHAMALPLPVLPRRRGPTVIDPPAAARPRRARVRLLSGACCTTIHCHAARRAHRRPFGFRLDQESAAWMPRRRPPSPRPASGFRDELWRRSPRRPGATLRRIDELAVDGGGLPEPAPRTHGAEPPHREESGSTASRWSTGGGGDRPGRGPGRAAAGPTPTRRWRRRCCPSPRRLPARLAQPSPPITPRAGTCCSPPLPRPRQPVSPPREDGGSTSTATRTGRAPRRRAMVALRIAQSEVQQ